MNPRQLRRTRREPVAAPALLHAVIFFLVTDTFFVIVFCAGSGLAALGYVFFAVFAAASSSEWWGYENAYGFRKEIEVALAWKVRVSS